jgi:hypothetical protein
MSALSSPGRLAIKHEDWTEVEVGPGEACVIEPGHDAWVVGDERFAFKDRNDTPESKRSSSHADD